MDFTIRVGRSAWEGGGPCVSKMKFNTVESFDPLPFWLKDLLRTLTTFFFFGAALLPLGVRPLRQASFLHYGYGEGRSSRRKENDADAQISLGL